MDAILFSAKPKNAEDAKGHLENHEKLYWEVTFEINKERFSSFPILGYILGYIHICGGQVKYKVTIQDILPFSPEHYSESFKPEQWVREWKEKINDKKSKQKQKQKYALVITNIEPFFYITKKILKINGEPVKNPPQRYTNVLPLCEKTVALLNQKQV